MSLLEITGLTHAFGGQPLFQNCRLWPSTGGSTCVVGRNGAGKSTLVRCINYLEAPTSGDVVFEGTSLKSLGRAGINQARKSMGNDFPAV